MLKCVYVILGSLALALGVLGIFLPVLPTTPFLLLAAAAYVRGSGRAYNWLINQRYLGAHIRDFREHRVVPVRAKIMAISLLWITSIHLVCLVFDTWWFKGGMIGIAVGVTLYLLSFKSRV